MKVKGLHIRISERRLNKLINYIATKQVQIFTVLVLMGILSVGSGLTLLKSATATPTNLLPANKNEVLEGNLTTNRNSLKNFPEYVKDAVLQAASQHLNLATDRLTIIQAEQQTWKDGCLELSKPDEVRTQVLVTGWRVAVGAVDQTLVYHTNDSGSIVKLNEKASEISESNLPEKVDESGRVADDEKVSTTTEYNAIKPLPIPTSDLPPALQSGVIFRQITSGGFAGRTYETVLMDDGRLIRVRVGDANNSGRSIHRISRSKVRQFQQLLEQENFSEFKNQNYPASGGAADYNIYILTNRDSTVEYNDLSQSSLPDNLQVVVKARNHISKKQK